MTEERIEVTYTKVWRWLVIVALAVGLSACGYSLMGRGSYLPEGIRALAVPPFVSVQSRPEVAESMRNAVVEELLSRTRLRIVASREEADAVLEGGISRFDVTPLEYGEESRATRAQASVSAGVVLKWKETREVIYENRAFSFRSEFELSEEAEDFYDPESEVVEEIAQRFARSLVSAMLEGF